MGENPDFSECLNGSELSDTASRESMRNTQTISKIFIRFIAKFAAGCF